MNEQEKRMVSDTGYEVKQSMKIGGKEILLAENMKAEDGQFYLVATYREKAFLAEYMNAVTSDDYLEAVQEFAGRISTEAETVRAEQNALNHPPAPYLYTAEHCLPYDYSQNIVGKVVAIKAEALAPEYRTGGTQLIYVTGGNGAKANPSGSGVYCYQLDSRTLARYERRDVLGIVKVECIPDWAKESYCIMQAEHEKPTAEKEFAGRYEITERIEVGQQVFALGYNENAVQPYGTWQGRKGSKAGFDLGHYFSTKEAAKSDLQQRAAREQKCIERPKRRGDGAR